MRRFLKSWSIVVGIASLGCIIPEEEENPIPPAVYEECSNDHLQYWSPDDDAEIYVNFRQPYTYNSGTPQLFSLTSDCNTVPFYGAGGGQGGGLAVFHIEPNVVVPAGNAEYNVNWRLMALEGNLLSEQGVELFAGDWVPEGELSRAAMSQIFIGPDLRGKNLRIEADVMDLNGETVTVGGAIWLGEER